LYEAIEQADTDVVGVNGDPQEANDRFRESLDLPFPLVGDPKGTILKSYGVRWPIIGIAKRVTYVIGKDRTVLSAFRNERNMTAHAAQACAFVSRVTAG
jgi:peroxiredoxin Q/BCP